MPMEEITPTSELTATPAANSTRWLLYGLWIVASLGLFLRPLAAVIHFAANNDDASHIFLIPFISAGVIFLERRAIFPRISYDLGGAAVLALVAVSVGTAVSLRHASWSPSQSLSAQMLALILIWIAGFILVFGRAAARAARFPLLLLVLAVPLPDFLLAQVVYFLQKGSAELVAVLFDLTDTPFLRQGVIFELGRFSIEIAQECSGIRSSLVLFITSLLAANLFLKSPWRRIVLVAAVIPLGILRNGLRIVFIGLLCVHFGPDMIHSIFHKRGGPPFFALSLIPLFLLLLWLRRNEQKTSNTQRPAPKAFASRHPTSNEEAKLAR